MIHFPLLITSGPRQVAARLCISLALLAARPLMAATYGGLPQSPTYANSPAALTLTPTETGLPRAPRLARNGHAGTLRGISSPVGSRTHVLPHVARTPRHVGPTGKGMTAPLTSIETAARALEDQPPAVLTPASPASDGGVPMWLIGSGVAVIGGVLAFLLTDDDAVAEEPIVVPEWPASGPPGRPAR